MFIWGQAYRINILITRVSNTEIEVQGKGRACRVTGDSEAKKMRFYWVG